MIECRERHRVESPRHVVPPLSFRLSSTISTKRRQAMSTNYRDRPTPQTASRPFPSFRCLRLILSTHGKIELRTVQMGHLTTSLPRLMFMRTVDCPLSKLGPVAWPFVPPPQRVATGWPQTLSVVGRILSLLRVGWSKYNGPIQGTRYTAYRFGLLPSLMEIRDREGWMRVVAVVVRSSDSSTTENANHCRRPRDVRLNGIHDCLRATVYSRK